MVAQEFGDRGASALPQRHAEDVCDRAIARRRSRRSTGRPAIASCATRRRRKCSSSGSRPAARRSISDAAAISARSSGRQLGRELHLHRLRGAGGRVAQLVERRGRRLVQIAGGFARKPGELARGQTSDDDQQVGLRRHAPDRRDFRASVVAELRDEEDAAILHAQPGRSAMVVSRRAPPEGSTTRASTVAILRRRRFRTD